MNALSWNIGLARVQLLLAFLVCGLLVGAAIARNTDYRDPLTLWSIGVSRTPGKARPHYNLGNAFRDRGDMEHAISEWRKAVTADPKYSMAYNQLGNVCLLSGSLADAERYYMLAVTSEPDNAEAHYNLALVSESLGKRGQAISHYQQFLNRRQGQSEEALRRAESRLRILLQP